MTMPRTMRDPQRVIPTSTHTQSTTTANPAHLTTISRHACQAAPPSVVSVVRNHTRHRNPINGPVEGISQASIVSANTTTATRTMHPQSCGQPTVFDTTDRMEFDGDGTVRHLTSSQRVKLTQDLAVVESNVNVLNDMLAELRPDVATGDDLALVQEIYQTCRAMHRRVMEFLSQVSDEEATPSLLQVNDNLNSAFMRFDRFERYRVRALRSLTETAQLELPSTTQLPALTHIAETINPAGAQQLAITAATNGGAATDWHSTNGSSQNGEDENLIDIESEWSNEDRNESSIDLDEVSKWLADRQMIVSVPTSIAPAPSNGTPSVQTVASLEQAIGSLALVPTSKNGSSIHTTTNHTDWSDAIVDVNLPTVTHNSSGPGKVTNGAQLVKENPPANTITTTSTADLLLL